MKLSLAEQLLLIAQHPEKNRALTSATHLHYGVAGALLMELSLAKLLTLDSKRLSQLQVVHSENELVNELSQSISQANKPRSIRYWINKIAKKSRNYQWRLLADLERKGHIKITQRHFLGLIPYRQRHLIDRKTRDTLIEKLRNGVLNGKAFNETDMAILGLVQACNLHRAIVPQKTERKVFRKKLKEMIQADTLTQEVGKLVDKQIQAAINSAIAASIAAAVAASAAARG